MDVVEVVLSAKLFWGFKLNFDVTILDLSLESQIIIINFTAKTELKKIFETQNLKLLIEEVEKLNLHLHEKLKYKNINYACDHCHNQSINQ